jgi:hypothetical protein
MKILVLIIALASIEFLSAQGEDYREFTNKDGRTIRAKIEWVKASEIDIKKEEILPGDILEFDNADLGGGMKIDGLHTAIVAKVKRRGAVEVYQQNTQHGKIVTCDPMDLRGLISGIVKVYRYE